MSVRSRLTALGLAVGAVVSMGLVASPVASAAPAVHQVAAQTKLFNIHGRAGNPKCATWGYVPSRANCRVEYDNGHSVGWNNVAGDVDWTSGVPTTFRLRTDDGNVVEGVVQGRDKKELALTKFVSPKFGTLVGGGQQLNLNVDTKQNFFTGDYTIDFYVSGNLTVDAPVGGAAGGGALSGLAGLLGSS